VPAWALANQRLHQLRGATRCHDRVEAPWLLDRPINGESRLLTVDSALVPTLKLRGFFVMDNLGSHTSRAVRRAIRAAGAPLLLRPKYAPDHNPIEQRFSKLNHWLRNAAKRGRDACWTTIAQILDAVSPSANVGVISLTAAMLLLELIPLQGWIAEVAHTDGWGLRCHVLDTLVVRSTARSRRGRSSVAEEKSEPALTRRFGAAGRGAFRKSVPEDGRHTTPESR
jgi:hypothetical protein